jgi:hypothetical protein
MTALPRDYGRRIYVTRRDLRRRHAARHGAWRLAAFTVAIASTGVIAHALHGWGFW